MDIGFVHYWWREVYKAAAAWFDRASKVPGAPWFLGESFSAIDLYLWPMTWWRPGRDWFKTNAPRILAISLKVENLAELKPIKERQRD